MSRFLFDTVTTVAIHLMSSWEANNKQVLLLQMLTSFFGYLVVDELLLVEFQQTYNEIPLPTIHFMSSLDFFSSNHFTLYGLLVFQL